MTAVKYINFVINRDDNTFYIIESFSKPKSHDLATITLSKIEFIIKNKLPYDSTRQDNYSNLSEKELITLLTEKSSQICRGYNAKQTKLNLLSRIIFSQEKQISEINIRIHNRSAPPRMLPLPDDLISNIIKRLNISNLQVLTQLNHHGKTHAGAIIAERAKEFGFEGGEDHIKEASKYIHALFNGVTRLVKQEMISKEYFFHKECYNGGKLDPEKALQTLKTDLFIGDIFRILSDEELYSSSFEKLRKILKKETIYTKKLNNGMQNNADSALILASKHGDRTIVAFLLEQGADPNTSDENGSAPLHFAAQKGYANIVELLLSYGANVDDAADEGTTALAFACGYGDREFYRPNAKVVDLLLSYGADPNIATSDGNTPLNMAKKYDYLDIISLLLGYGAHQ